MEDGGERVSQRHKVQLEIIRIGLKMRLKMQIVQIMSLISHWACTRSGSQKAFCIHRFDINHRSVVFWRFFFLIFINRVLHHCPFLLLFIGFWCIWEKHWLILRMWGTGAILPFNFRGTQSDAASLDFYCHCFKHIQWQFIGELQINIWQEFISLLHRWGSPLVLPSKSSNSTVIIAVWSFSTSTLNGFSCTFVLFISLQAGFPPSFIVWSHFSTLKPFSINNITFWSELLSQQSQANHIYLCTLKEQDPGMDGLWG